MNTNAIKHFYDYHFGINRFMWDSYIIQLTPEQFAQPSLYSHGSVQDQILHLIAVDEVWFSDLLGEALPKEAPQPDDFPNYASLRAHWDGVEQKMRGYLANLSDEMLDTQPLSGEDADLRLWQILLHVVNHGTDHRAQILRLINDLGVETTSQDYIFYAYENPT